MRTTGREACGNSATKEKEKESMLTLARVVTRPSNDGGTECDLIVGTMMRGMASRLKPNFIYEIRECLGVLSLVEVGESLISPVAVKDSPIGITWCQTFDAVVMQAGKYLLISKGEFDMIQKEALNEQTTSY
jgi:hypothetical protein